MKKGCRAGLHPPCTPDRANRPFRRSAFDGRFVDKLARPAAALGRFGFDGFRCFDGFADHWPGAQPGRAFGARFRGFGFVTLQAQRCRAGEAGNRPFIGFGEHRTRRFGPPIRPAIIVAVSGPFGIAISIAVGVPALAIPVAAFAIPIAAFAVAIAAFAVAAGFPLAIVACLIAVAVAEIAVTVAVRPVITPVALIVTLAIVTGAIVTGAIIALAVGARRVVGALLAAIVAIILIIGFDIVVAVETGAVVIIAVTTGAILIGRLVIAEDAVIVIGILQIIFGGHPVTRLLGITRQGAVFFEQLAGVAALPVIEAVAVIIAAIHLLRARAIVVAAAPAPILVVSDQDGVPVFTDGKKP
jgi:hypothetical protein